MQEALAARGCVMRGFAQTGWRKFPYDPALAAWVEAVRPAALATLEDAAHARWWRNDRTWFVGVNALANDGEGALAAEAGPPLAGAAVAFAAALNRGPVRWDPAQISAVLPGYPRQGDDSDAAFAFRRARDGAHVDGLHLVEGRRMLREMPAFLLGIALNEAGPGASPLVVWEGSHVIMAQALRDALAGIAPDRWGEVDLSAAYKDARRVCFARCKRVELHGAPGEAHVLHALALHGVSPWQAGAWSEAPGRVVAYFRPETNDRSHWLAV